MGVHCCNGGDVCFLPLTTSVFLVAHYAYWQQKRGLTCPSSQQQTSSCSSTACHFSALPAAGRGRGKDVCVVGDIGHLLLI